MIWQKMNERQYPKRQYPKCQKCGAELFYINGGPCDFCKLANDIVKQVTFNFLKDVWEVIDPNVQHKEQEKQESKEKLLEASRGMADLEARKRVE